MQSTLDVVVFNQAGIQLFKDTFPTTATVGHLKQRLDDFDQLSVDLETKDIRTKDWRLLFSAEDFSLLSVRDTVAHPRSDGALHFRARSRPVWRIQAFIGIFADPFVVRAHVVTLRPFVTVFFVSQISNLAAVQT
jgi:hypothetical protein